MLNVLLKKTSFKIQTVCQYSVIKDTVFSFVGEKKGQLIIYNNTAGVNNASIEPGFVSSKSVNSSVDSLDDTLQSQKIEVSDKIEVEFDSDPISRIEKIIIVVYQTKKSRGSSYIPTPLQYNNSRCGLINIKNEDDKCFYWCMKYHSSKQEKIMID